MRVLQLGPYPPPHGGVQTNLVAIRDLLRKNGHWCGVINITRHRAAEADDVYYPRNAVETLWLLLTLQYDIVHIHLGGNLTSRLLALCLVCCAVPRARSVLTLHSGGYPSSPAGRRARPRSLPGFIFRRFDKIIAVNREIAGMFQRFGVPQARIHVIAPHARPVLTNQPLPERLRHFLARHDPVLLTVGLLEPEYDLGLQIDLLGQIRERHPAAGLVIAGSGSLELELRRRIQESGHAEHVLLYGDMPHPVTLRAIAGCDVLLRTTTYDGDSVAVHEALQFGTPVIATDNGMRPDGVHLIPSGDKSALAEAIYKILSVPRAGVLERQQLKHDNIELVVNLYLNAAERSELVTSAARS